MMALLTMPVAAVRSHTPALGVLSAMLGNTAKYELGFVSQFLNVTASPFIFKPEHNVTTLN